MKLVYGFFYGRKGVFVWEKKKKTFNRGYKIFPLKGVNIARPELYVIETVEPENDQVLKRKNKSISSPSIKCEGKNNRPIKNTQKIEEPIITKSSKTNANYD